MHAPFPYSKFDALPVGIATRLSVKGIFENGTLNLSFRTDYRLESSDPGVAAVVENRFLRGVAPGTAMITAYDLATGIASAPLAVQVVGALDSITLTPATATRGIGEWESFTAVGHYPPFTRRMTQELVYSSSDPSVAVADNTLHMRSRVRTVGAGTATITATDPRPVSARARCSPSCRARSSA